jgi:superfamily II RNA helicase
MVVICDSPYPTETPYQSYFDTFPYPLSDFQKYAIQSIVEGNHVLVTAHTGSGKTLPAEFAIQHFVQSGARKRVIYTSPIKALSNQKYHEFSQKYPEISFGLLTGDIKTNPDADVLIMTTEILMNYLFTAINSSSADELPNAQSTGLQFQIDVQTELACVIFDEVHYINDADRGQVWEKTILMLPRQVQMIMLSATIDNPAGFADWCERGEADAVDGKKVYLASTNHRVVPLSHYGFLTTTESIFKSVRDKTVQQEIRDATNNLIPLQDAIGKYNESGYKQIVRMTKLFETHRMDSKRKHVLNQLSLFLREREMLPAIAFVFSRKQVESCAHDITVPLTEFDSKIAYTVRRECEQIVRKLPNYQEYLQLPEYNQLVSLLEKGIGIHHSGMIPVLREIVELMISKRNIKLLFATESFAIGLDCPIKTAIFTSLTKFDGQGQRHLMSHEYTQMAGRAGRRGIDTIGHVVHCNNLFSPPTLKEYQTILGGVPQKLVSKYYISYSLVLNLIKNGQTRDFHTFSEKSMVHRELTGSLVGQRTRIADLESTISAKSSFVEKARTPLSVCDEYLSLEETYKTAVNKKRKNAERELQRITDQYKHIKEDLSRIRELHALEEQLRIETESTTFTENYIRTQTNNVVAVLLADEFIIERTDGITTPYYEFTPLGKMASSIAEIHPLILTGLVETWNHFAEFSPTQLVGLFSCFTDVKVPDNIRHSVPTTDDLFLKDKIRQLSHVYALYDTREGEMQMRTGINYTESMQFDLIDLAMQWCDCSTEEECKRFIQNDVNLKSISLGDITKAMLKIATITKEWMNVFTQCGNIDALHKFSQIEGMILKYITTSQSLYV